LKKRKEEIWGVLIYAIDWEERPNWLNIITKWDFAVYNKHENRAFFNTSDNTFISDEIVVMLYRENIASLAEAEFIAQNAHQSFDPDPDVFKV